MGVFEIREKFRCFYMQSMCPYVLGESETHVKDRKNRGTHEFLCDLEIFANSTCTF